MRKSIRILLARQKQMLKASSPKSRDKNRARLKVLQICELLGKKPRRAAA